MSHQACFFSPTALVGHPRALPSFARALATPRAHKPVGATRRNLSLRANATNPPLSNRRVDGSGTSELGKSLTNPLVFAFATCPAKSVPRSFIDSELEPLNTKLNKLWQQCDPPFSPVQRV